MSAETAMYARRTAETAVIAHIESAIGQHSSLGVTASGAVALGAAASGVTALSAAAADATASSCRLPLRVVVLLGDPGNGARSILLRGVVPSLGDRAAPIRGAWHPVAPIQCCGSAGDVPASSPELSDALRVLVVACHDLSELPGWLRAPGALRPQVFTVSTLSLTELVHYLETELGAPIELAAGRRLGAAAGFVPAVLSWLLRELRESGRMELVDGVWHLIGDAVPDIVLRQVRMRVAALPPSVLDSILRLALSEPVDYSTLSAADRAATESLRREGVIHRGRRGEVSFRAPAIAEALRELGPSHLAEEAYEGALASGHVTEPVMRWALRNGRELPATFVDRVVADALARQDWARALTLSELAIEHAVSGRESETTDSKAAEQMRRRCELHLGAATAARLLADADRANNHLDEAVSLAGNALAPPWLSTRVSIVRAEVLHFLEGDPDAALQTLGEHPSNSDRERAELLSHRVIHLAVAGRVRQARALLMTGKALLRRAPHGLRMRVKACAIMLQVTYGRPKQALRQSLGLLAQSAITTKSEPGVTAEVQSAYVIAALSSDGPAAFPALAKHFEDTRDDSYHPDLIAFAFARATWAYAVGEITEAHELAKVALDAAERSDPAGLESALVALLSETSALLGERDAVVELQGRFSRVSARASGFLLGGSSAHLAAAGLALGMPDTTRQLLATARQYLGEDRAGFAAELLYVGVRFGKRQAAVALCEFSSELDGNLHRLRVAHASALLDDDPVALLAVAAQFERVGSVLYAAEAAALVALNLAAPETTRRRARAIVARLSPPGLEGHPLLGGIAAEVSTQITVTPLTPREGEILELIDAGLSNLDIAQRLSLSTRTVEGHITRLYRKTGGARRAPGWRAFGSHRPAS